MKDYIYAVSSTNPTPGGGSVCAVVAQLSSALASMACSISAQSKTNTNAQQSSELKALSNELDECIALGEQLAQQDEFAYQQVLSAFKLNSSTDEEKEIRQKAIKESCSLAAQVPLEVIELSARVFNLTYKASHMINKSLLSDVAIVVALLQAVSKSALYLVHANLAYLDISDAQRVYKMADEQCNSLACQINLLQEELDSKLLLYPHTKDDE